MVNTHKAIIILITQYRERYSIADEGAVPTVQLLLSAVQCVLSLQARYALLVTTAPGRIRDGYVGNKISFNKYNIFKVIILDLY